MNNIVPFNFKNQSVRVVMIGNGPFWVAKDVCDVLGLDNVSMALDRLDDDEKGVSIVDTLGGPQKMSIINESGLYSLILASRKPEAKEFKRWVTQEVLPSIHRTGSYSTDQLPSAKSPIGILKAREEFEAAIGFVKLFGITDANQTLFAADNMVRGFYGVSPLGLAGCAQLPAPTPAVQLSPTAIGLELGGMKPREVNKLLESIGLQTCVDKQWQATPAGEPHSVRVDVQTRHNSGAPVTQLRWYATVLDVLRDALDKRRAQQGEE